MRRIPLTQGQVALVDDDDFEWLSREKWMFHKKPSDLSGYAIRCGYDPATGKRPRVAMHRILMGARPGQLVDHANGNTLDNRRRNLRIATHYQSVLNRGPNRGRTIPAEKGVTCVRDRRGTLAYWIARITVQGRRIYLGVFPGKEAAAEAYRKAAQKFHGEWARGISG